MIHSYRSGVSLHGHTSHSRESLKFLYNLAKRSCALQTLIERGERQYRSMYGAELDLHKGWWTPPVSPYQAWVLERAQLEALGLSPMVSISDHDTISGVLSVRATADAGDIPISVEWSVPHMGTEIHIGIHNLPADVAADTRIALNEYTRNPSPRGPGELLEYVAAQPGCLVVLNHPLWDESCVGAEQHITAVRDLLGTCGAFIHALEWNGLRSRRENLCVVGLAHAWSKPVVSGGDRHTFEANSVLNLTNAGCFGEFVEEVRNGHSTCMLTPTYMQPKTLRLLRMLSDILSAPSQGNGWTLWSDRVFYIARDGEPESLTSLMMKNGTPNPIRALNAVTKLLHALPWTGVLNLTAAGRKAELV